jgi:hypothetical protein
VLTLSFDTHSSSMDLRLTDITGKVVISRKLENLAGKHEEDLDLSDLANGIYMLRVDTETGTVIRRIIKE